MKRFVRYFFSYLLPLAVGVALLLYLFQEHDFKQLRPIIAQAPLGWILLSVIFALVAHWARAYRWRYLLYPLGYQPPTSHTLVAVLLGYFANLLLPRMGEVTRCALLQQTYRVPFNESFGTVIAERIIDLILLSTFVVLVISIEFDHIGPFVVKLLGERYETLSISTTLIAICLLVGTVSVCILWHWMKKHPKHAFVQKTKRFATGIWQGIQTIRSVRNKTAFIFFTLLIWLMYYLMAYVLLFCHPVTRQLSIWAALGVFVMGGLGIAAPVQGGIGAYHFLTMQAFVLYGLDEGFSLLFATFMHTVQTLTTVLLGGVAFLASIFLKKRNLYQEPSLYES